MTDRTTTAMTLVQASPALLPDGMMQASGVTGLIAAGIVGFLALRRRLSRDNLEVAKDRAEGDLIKSYQDTIRALQEQNAKLDENAREAWRSRAEDAKRIGELSAKVEHLTTINHSLESTVAQMKAQQDITAEMIRALLPAHVRVRFAHVSGSDLPNLLASARTQTNQSTTLEDTP